MLEQLIKELEKTNIEMDDNNNMDRLNLLSGLQQGLIRAMYIVDFRGTNNYFDKCDDLPY